MLFHFTRVRTESIIFLSAPRLRMRACFGDEREFGASAMQWGKAKSRMHRAVIAIVAVRYHNSQRIGFGAAVPTDGKHPYDAIRRHLVKSTHIESLALSLSHFAALFGGGFAYRGEEITVCIRAIVQMHIHLWWVQFLSTLFSLALTSISMVNASRMAYTKKIK